MEIKFSKLTTGELARLMNMIVEHMNCENAYYGSWLYTWPDGSTQKECLEEFADKEFFEELEIKFINRCCYYLPIDDVMINPDDRKLYKAPEEEVGGGLYVPNSTPTEIEVMLGFLKYWGFPMKKSEQDVYILDTKAYKSLENPLWVQVYNQLNQ